MALPERHVRIAKNFYEKEKWALNQLVIGVDEVGRGCLCGPLVTSAVILHPGKVSQNVKDSKLLNKQELQDAYNWIIKNSWHSTSIVTHRIIDEFNIYQATLKSMKRAVIQLNSISPRADLILVDAMPLKVDNFEVIHFNFGEKHSSSIAAASIVAKVTRDKIMERLDNIIPGYYMAQHKGYSTKLHMQNLEFNGESVIHRKSFLKNFLFLSKEDHGQKTIW